MKDKVFEIIQHVLTVAGGILVTKGVLDDVLWQSISGGVIALSGAIWSLIVFIKNKDKIEELEVKLKSKK